MSYEQTYSIFIASHVLQINCLAGNVTKFVRYTLDLNNIGYQTQDPTSDAKFGMFMSQRQWC